MTAEIQKTYNFYKKIQKMCFTLIFILLALQIFLFAIIPQWHYKVLLVACMFGMIFFLGVTYFDAKDNAEAVEDLLLVYSMKQARKDGQKNK